MSFDGETAVVGLNAYHNGFPYPVSQQFGATKAGRGRNVNLPPRPFLPIDPDGDLMTSERENIQKLVDKILERAVASKGK